MGDNPFEGKTFNIIKHLGDPGEATLESGHTVYKEEYVYFKNDKGQYVAMKCADYHGAHFVYLDPVYNVDGKEGMGHFFAMCSCGSPAVIVGPTEAQLEITGWQEQLLVCYVYHGTLKAYGHGWHQGQEGRKWQ
ncbi:hypothetical protein LCGC14_1928370 [marine sediment metagenome]|uniref:Uncharacterized protein n=1 Tax=marine sediment metagenome TaxID=412755 RepID=A0A0F9ILJ5_9ZZZZ